MLRLCRIFASTLAMRSGEATLTGLPERFSSTTLVRPSLNARRYQYQLNGVRQHKIHIIKLLLSHELLF
ncbi:hypothetical protein PGB90_006929 [Kerria lacca]